LKKKKMGEGGGKRLVKDAGARKILCRSSVCLVQLFAYAEL
jgi:hypothetical protein